MPLGPRRPPRRLSLLLWRGPSFLGLPAISSRPLVQLPGYRPVQAASSFAEVQQRTPLDQVTKVPFILISKKSEDFGEEKKVVLRHPRAESEAERRLGGFGRQVAIASWVTNPSPRLE